MGVIGLQSPKIKKILIEIRKDLYGDTLTPLEVNVVNPGTKIMSALEIFGKHKDILIQEKLDSFKSLSQMNIDEIHNKR